jgi:hypothetical protein
MFQFEVYVVTSGMQRYAEYALISRTARIQHIPPFTTLLLSYVRCEYESLNAFG